MSSAVKPGVQPSVERKAVVASLRAHDKATSVSDSVCERANPVVFYPTRFSLARKRSQMRSGGVRVDR